MAKRRNGESGAATRSAAHTTDAHERDKDFLNASEIDRLLDGAKEGRHGTRDHLLMLMISRHGLRVSEAITLRRDNVNLQGARLAHRVRPRHGRRLVQHVDGEHQQHPRDALGYRRVLRPVPGYVIRSIARLRCCAYDARHVDPTTSR